MKACSIMRIANAIKVVAKATRNKWLIYKYIVWLNKAIDKDIQEFRECTSMETSSE